jgi:soluble lytic murein transglycosylase-like protein
MMKRIAIAAALLAIMMSAGRAARAGACADESRVLQRLEVESILDDVAMIHSIDPGLLSAIARVESDECPDAVSRAGAAGLMQLMPATASQFGVDDRFDPVQNALGAARFIDYLRRDRPDGNLTLPEVLAAYNAGEAAVTRAGGIPHYRETEQYVRRVLWIYLIGHVPESEVARERVLAPPRHQSKVRASIPAKATQRFTDGDSAILEQMAQLRRAREQASAAGQ